MNLTQCEQAIQTQFDKNPNGLDNVSQLTNLARSKDKVSCMTQMGGIAHIKQFFTDKPGYITYQKTNPVATTTQTTIVANTNRRTNTRNTIGGQSSYFFRGLAIIV
jgi:hypothetical protein